MEETSKIKPCPFCGETEKFTFDTNQGTKWGFIQCACAVTGPEVRTSYDTSADAEWHKDAIKEWNIRKIRFKCPFEDHGTVECIFKVEDLCEDIATYPRDPDAKCRKAFEEYLGRKTDLLAERGRGKKTKKKNKKLHEHYSGKKSIRFWKIINKELPEENWDAAYSLGCVLQNTEGFVLNYINNHRRKKQNK